MDGLLGLLKEHRDYILIAIGILVALCVLRWLLNRRSQEETAHAKRLEDLKRQSKDRYKDLRPLK